MSIVIDLREYYEAEHSTKSECPVCRRMTYGPMNSFSPSGWQAHKTDCEIPDYCGRCGGPKTRSWRYCKKCDVEVRFWKQAKEGLIAREEALARESLPSECAYCGQGGELGLYGPLQSVTAHFGCFLDNVSP